MPCCAAVQCRFPELSSHTGHCAQTESGVFFSKFLDRPSADAAAKKNTHCYSVSSLPYYPLCVFAGCFFSFVLFFPAKDFINSLMEKDPSKRYTCEQALRHPWWVSVSDLSCCNEDSGLMRTCGRVLYTASLSHGMIKTPRHWDKARKYHKYTYFLCHFGMFPLAATFSTI